MQVYLILGSRGSGRRAVVADLAAFGLREDDKAAVVVSPEEASSGNESLGSVALETYRLEEATLLMPDLGDCNVVFVLADGAGNPADFVEAFHAWLTASGYELSRALTILDCSLLRVNKALDPWYDCCVHFSDVVLLSNRQNVPNKWIKDLMDSYKKRCFPCLFEYVKKGRVANPALILDTAPRRISMVFDPQESLDAEKDEEDEWEEPSIAGLPEEDPYLKRLSSGARERQLPEIKAYLATSA